MEEQIRRIVDGDVVAAVLLFPSGNGFMGSILDQDMQSIFANSGLTYWPGRTVQEVLIGLERWANQVREREATEPHIWIKR